MTADDRGDNGIEAVWQRHARQWQQVGAPLRPTTEDADFMMALAAPVLREPKAAITVGIMGVTPEVVQLPWPMNVRVAAVDHSSEMIASVWRPHPRVPAVALRARWQEMPFDAGSVDLMVGDGSLNVLAGLREYAAVFSEISRVLGNAGSLILRCFIRPAAREDSESVARAAHDGAIGSFHAFKWRLAMSLVDDERSDVAVSDVHSTFNRLFPDRSRLAEKAGWAREAVDTIDAYEGKQVGYTFPTLEILRHAAHPFFTLETVRRGQYELADRCPTVLFRPLGLCGETR